MPIDEINEVMTDEERRKGTNTGLPRKDQSSLRVCPNSPLAAQVVEDKIIDMLLFITFRHLKYFKQWKQKRIIEIEASMAMARQQEEMYASQAKAEGASVPTESKRTSQIAERHE